MTQPQLRPAPPSGGKNWKTPVVAAILAVAAALFACRPLSAQSTAVEQKTSAANSVEALAVQQRRIAEQYRHFEDVLLRLAEMSAATDPRRAELLRKAVSQSKEQLISVRFERIVEMIGKEQLSRAIENQTDLGQDLRGLMELLMSENRAKSIEREKVRLRDYIKRLSGILRQEKDIQARTAGGDESRRLADEQGKVAGKTRGLAEDVRKAAAEKGRAAADSPQRNGEKQGGENDGEDDARQGSAQKRLENAKQRMEEAEKRLRGAHRQNAVEKQEEAVRELERARAELEETLRQLRQEEIGRVLTMLDARFRKMLQMQQEVYEGTVRLDKTPEGERTHNHEIEAGRLSGRESQIVVEVDKASLLLREDGTAVAFPEAVEQMRDDMQQVVARLARTKVNRITQGIEEDVLAALRDMLESLKKAQRDLENRKTPSQQGRAGQSQDPPLVDVLSELRMVRALQMRVNARTARYSKMLKGEQAEDAEVIEALRRLAERQQRIYRVTHDLQAGKNQ